MEPEVRFSIGIENKGQVYFKSALDLPKTRKYKDSRGSSLFSHLNVSLLPLNQSLWSYPSPEGLCDFLGIELNWKFWGRAFDDRERESKCFFTTQREVIWRDGKPLYMAASSVGFLGWGTHLSGWRYPG